MPHLEVNGLSLYYDQYGEADGRPVLLLPGLGEHHKGWLEVAWRLKDRWRVIVMDPRDAGLSARASGPYTIRDMASDASAVLAGIGIATADVVGYSMGGAIAQEMALNEPGRVRRLVLIATYDAGDTRGAAIFRQFAHLRRILSREDYYRTLLPWVYAHGDVELGVPLEETALRLAADPLYQEPDAYERHVQAALEFRSRERTGALRCPTLLIFGEDDTLTPLRFARSLATQIQGSRLVLLAGTGHGLIWTRSAEVAGLIDGFLGLHL